MTDPDGAPAETADATPEEVAAVTAAVTLLWPGAQVAEVRPAPPRWRFSGRWWSKPVPLARARPWLG